MAKHKRIEKPCEVCGTVFVSWNPNPRFCSTKCFGHSMETPVDGTLLIQLYESGRSQEEVAAALGLTQKKVWKFLRRAGIRCRPQKMRPDRRGPKTPAWRGGRSISCGGYVLIWKPDHPRAQKKSGYVFEHILVAEEKLGRPLVWKGPGHPDTEIVHHRNGNKQDNGPENIEVVRYAQHMSIHAALRKRGVAQ